MQADTDGEQSKIQVENLGSIYIHASINENDESYLSSTILKLNKNASILDIEWQK